MVMSSTYLGSGSVFAIYAATDLPHIEPTQESDQHDAPQLRLYVGKDHGSKGPRAQQQEGSLSYILGHKPAGATEQGPEGKPSNDRQYEREETDLEDVALLVLQPPEPGEQDGRRGHDEQHVQPDDSIRVHRGDGLGPLSVMFPGQHPGLQQIAADDPLHNSGARSFVVRPWLLNEGTVTIKIDYSNGSREVL